MLWWLRAARGLGLLLQRRHGMSVRGSLAGVGGALGRVIEQH